MLFSVLDALCGEDSVGEEKRKAESIESNNGFILGGDHVIILNHCIVKIEITEKYFFYIAFL